MSLPRDEIEGRIAGRVAMQEVLRQRLDRIVPVVFLESENSHMIVERKDSVTDYENIIKSLDRTALNEEASRELIAKLAT